MNALTPACFSASASRTPGARPEAPSTTGEVFTRSQPDPAISHRPVFSRPLGTLKERLQQHGRVLTAAVALAMVPLLPGCATMMAQEPGPQTQQVTVQQQAQVGADKAGQVAGRIGGFFANAGKSLAQGTTSGYQETQGQTATNHPAPETKSQARSQELGKHLGHIGGFFKNLGQDFGQSVKQGYDSTQQH